MKGLKSKFNREHLEIFNKAGCELSDDKDYSEDEIANMEEVISDFFAYQGLGESDTVNKTGLICEEIMDIFAGI